MLAAVVFVALLGLVLVLSRRGGSRRVRIDTCCAKHAWPPDDLTGAPADRPAR